jgi:hypothetical protein
MNHLHDVVPTMALKGHVRIFEFGNPSNIIYEEPNLIVDCVRSLFARLMANSKEPAYGVWGLGLGSGSDAWTSTIPPKEDTIQPQPTALYRPVLRKKISFVKFVDADLNPVKGFSEKVDFQTIVKSNEDGLISGTNGEALPIREMGLLGGGSTVDNTQMETANPWNPDSDLATSPGFISTGRNHSDTVTLINYKTLPSLILPDGIPFIFSWILTFVFLMAVNIGNAGIDNGNVKGHTEGGGPSCAQVTTV